MAVLVGDIGGTKTVLALAECRGVQVQLDAVRRYASADFATFEALLADYLRQHNAPISGAAFAVAGPVDGETCETTNLPWLINACDLEQQFQLPRVRLLNDLEAMAWGLPALTADQQLTLQVGQPQRRGNAVIVAAGTGLGQAGLFWDGQRHHPFATEGGHSDFAPADAREWALLTTLAARHGRVSWERVVSGLGIVNLYEHIAANDTGGNDHPQLIATRDAGGDLTVTIAQLAASGECPRCQITMTWLAELYGREAGNCALKHLAYGGVYLAGSVAANNVALLQRGEFLRGFLAKGRMETIVTQIPISIILDVHLPLRGAARLLMSS